MSRGPGPRTGVPPPEGVDVGYPLYMSLISGLRVDVFDFPIEIIEQALGIELELMDDLELGGANYSYAPYPLPQFGLLNVRLHDNDVPDLGLTIEDRPDLVTWMSIQFSSSNLLDLGRLEWRIRAALGDLFDVVEYSFQTLPPAKDPSQTVSLHRVTFEAVQHRRSVPVRDATNLDCKIDFELAEGDQASLQATISGLVDSGAVMQSFDLTPTSNNHLRQTFCFHSPSILDLGRYAQAVSLTFGDRVKILGYSVCGDLQHDGKMLRIEHTFGSAADAIPFWEADPNPNF